MGKALVHNPYHISSVRGSLTRSLGRCLPEIHDEIEHAFDDVLALKGNGPYLSLFYKKKPSFNHDGYRMETGPNT
jgi:hypothetical protein